MKPATSRLVAPLLNGEAELVIGAAAWRHYGVSQVKRMRKISAAEGVSSAAGLDVPE